MKTALRILLIEDDQDDVDLFRYALKINAIPSELNVIMDGEEVAPYLLTAPRLPQVIVMDLNLPKIHGRDVLRQIKASPGFKDVPVVVLTTSSAQEDKEYCAAWGVHAFVTKPTSMLDFNATATTIVTAAQTADK